MDGPRGTGRCWGSQDPNSRQLASAPRRMRDLELSIILLIPHYCLNLTLCWSICGICMLQGFFFEYFYLTCWLFCLCASVCRVEEAYRRISGPPCVTVDASPSADKVLQQTLLLIRNNCHLWGFFFCLHYFKLSLAQSGCSTSSDHWVPVRCYRWDSRRAGGQIWLWRTDCVHNEQRLSGQEPELHADTNTY